MKKNIVALVFLLIASTSNALVADKFKCSFEIKDLNSKNSTKQVKELYIARLPTSPLLPLGASSEPKIRLTMGQIMERITLDTPEAQFGANLNFYFKHANRIASNGSIEARQLTCIGLTVDYCKYGNGDGISLCGESSVRCMEPTNPFDTNNGWAETTMSGSIPTFNEQTLAPASKNITDDNGKIVGIVNLSCQYLGSFN